MAIAKNLSFYMNGYNLATALSSFDATATIETVDATSLAYDYREFEFGFEGGSLSFNGYFRHDGTDTDEIHNVMSSAFANRTQSIITASYETLAAGVVALMVKTSSQGYNVSAPLGQILSVSGNFDVSNAVNFGLWNFSAAVNNTSTNGSSTDNTSSSTNGGVFQAHVQNPSELAGNIKLQHSTDNSSWADLVTLTLTGTGAKYEGLQGVVNAGTTINRYTRARATATGGSITFQAAFARR